MASINNLYELLDSDKSQLQYTNEINDSLSKHNNSLNIIYTNIRSLIKHFNDFEYLSTSLNDKCDIIITSEAWIGQDSYCEYFTRYKGFNTEFTKMSSKYY